MERSKGTLVIITGFFLSLLMVVDKFVSDGPVKLVASCLLAAGSFYQIINMLAPEHHVVRVLNSYIRKFAIGRLLIGEGVNASELSGDDFFSFKSQLLLFTTEELKKRSDFVGNNENFTFDLGVEDDFAEGADPVNHSKSWQDHLHEQFVFITGRSGSGKTFELIKRVQYICHKLMPGLSDRRLLEKVKIPIYVELRTLDRQFNKDWIADYLFRTAKVAGYPLKKVQLQHLLTQREAIFFFDGVDEIRPAFRDQAISYILNELTPVGVHLTCRTQIYQDLLERHIIPEGRRPAEYPLLPLSPEWIKMVIRSLTDRPALEIEEMIALIEARSGLMRYLTRPIFFNLFVLVYHNLDQEEKQRLTSAEEAAATDILWEKYEDIMYRKKLDRNSDMLGIRTITVWLAKIMHQQSFFVESIQPSWLSRIDDQHRVVPYKRLQQLYVFSTRVLASAIIGIALGCIVATPFALLANSILGGILITLLAGAAHRFTGERFWNRSAGKIVFTLTMVFILVLCCGFFQGLLLPRAPGDMLTPYFSVVECWPGVLTGITLSTIFSYRIIMENARRQYILPVELFRFDWRHAIQYGLTWGVMSGIITGAIALYVKKHYDHHLFIKEWLVPYLKNLMQQFNGVPLSEQNLDLAIFIYAFLLTFFVASIIIVLLAGRYNDIPEPIIKNKQKLNYGIRKSGRHALFHALNVALLTSIIYYLIMFRFDIGNLYFIIKITAGITLLAFLWFGGMEVINHWLLRINLFSRGIAPLNYTEWVAAQQRMGLIIPSGYQMSFYHTSLAAYYIRYPMADNPRIRLAKGKPRDLWAYGAAIAILVLLMTAPFIRRYALHTLWRSPYEISPAFKTVRLCAANEYEVERAGIYNVACSGYINVGTFVGYVKPAGTRYGFMGMPINDPYDIDSLKKFPHAALLYRVKRTGSRWTAFQALAVLTRISLRKGDHLQFLTNDKEWQNNIGRYTVCMAPCDSCKK